MPSFGQNSWWGGRKSWQRAFAAPAMSRPPSNVYDPSIDAQQGAANRGLGDLRIDTEKSRDRLGQDLQSSLADLMLGRARAAADRDKAIGDVQLGYRQLGRRQAEGARSRGVLSQGLAEKSAQVRATNQQRDESPIMQAFDRYMADSKTQEAGLARDQARQGEDLTLGLARGEREGVMFGQDANTLRWWQAAQQGFVQPTVGDVLRGTMKPKKKKGRR